MFKNVYKYDKHCVVTIYGIFISNYKFIVKILCQPPHDISVILYLHPFWTGILYTHFKLIKNFKCNSTYYDEYEGLPFSRKVC